MSGKLKLVKETISKLVVGARVRSCTQVANICDDDVVPNRKARCAATLADSCEIDD